MVLDQVYVHSMVLKFGHTPHTMKHIIELVVVSPNTNIMYEMNYRFIKPQNGPTFHEHIVTCMKTTKMDDKEIGLNLKSKHKIKGPKQ
jgi:hypothetical protein